MRQLPAIVLAAVVLSAGCGERKPLPPAGGIVSLTPAGTDLLSAMGLADRIVGVSSYEPNESLRRKLPKVGDYLRVDFERVAELRPKYMVVQGKRDRLPAGTRERCTELGIAPIILQIDRYDDIKRAITQIGDATGNEQAARSAVTRMDEKAKTIQSRVTGESVPTLLVFGDGGANVVGVDTFIDDALTLAGGRNVVEAVGYPTVDAEKLRSLKPAVIFLLLPGANEAAVNRAKAALPSGGTQKVFALTDPNVLMPGTATLGLAAEMADHLRASK